MPQKLETVLKHVEEIDKDVNRAIDKRISQISCL